VLGTRLGPDGYKVSSHVLMSPGKQLLAMLMRAQNVTSVSAIIPCYAGFLPQM